MFLLSSFFFFYFAGVGVYIIFLPKILQNVGYLSYEIGIVFSIVPLMRFLTPFLFLKIFTLSKKVFKLSLLVSFICVGLLFFTIHNFYLLSVDIAFFGMANALVMPYVDAIALEKLKNSYGKSRLWGSLGFMIVGLVLAKFFTGYKIGLWFYLVIAFMVTLFGYIISKRSSEFNLKKDNLSVKFDMLKHWHFWISIFLVQLSFGIFYSFFTIYENSHGISIEQISYLWSLSIVCEIAMFIFQERLLKLNLAKVIKFAIFVTTLRWFLLYLFPSFLVVVSLTQTFHAISFALFHSATIVYLYRLYKQKKLAMQFYHGISYGLGGFAGSLLGGYFYGEYIFLIASFIALIALILAPNSSV